MAAQDRPKWTVQIVRCGGCGKPRGIRHTCVRRLGRRPQRTRLKPQVRVRCGQCGQRRTPFGAHLCRTDFKKRKRRHVAARRRAREQAARRRRRAKETAARQARRRREAEARKRRREREDANRRERRQRERGRERQRRQNAATARKATPRSQRGRKPSPQPGPGRRPDPHPYDQCQDDDCRRRACVAYREGHEEGFDEGVPVGYKKGFPDGIAACPRPHSPSG
jgi:hypothetical protein